MKDEKGIRIARIIIRLFLILLLVFPLWIFDFGYGEGYTDFHLILLIMLVSYFILKELSDIKQQLLEIRALIDRREADSSGTTSDK